MARFPWIEINQKNWEQVCKVLKYWVSGLTDKNIDVLDTLEDYKLKNDDTRGMGYSEELLQKMNSSKEVRKVAIQVICFGILDVH